MYNPMDLTGKKIIITGASSGIGRETAIRASRLGATVSLVSRNEAALKETIAAMEPGLGHAYFLCDLSRTEEIEPLVKRIVAEQGSQDGFVHCAGISIVRPIRMTKPQFLDNTLRVHVYAFVEFIRSLSKRNNLNNGASLVGISSAAARTGNPGQNAYSAAKAAMDGVIVPIARELGPRGIRVNTVAFAWTKTAMSEAFFELVDKDHYAASMSSQYLGMIDVEDAANAILFLLSDAVRYITEARIPVYGGYK